jgi:hypothetical protein
VEGDYVVDFLLLLCCFIGRVVRYFSCCLDRWSLELEEMQEMYYLALCHV